MKNVLLAWLLTLTALGAQAQTLTINNHTACPVNAYLFIGTPAFCPSPSCGSGGVPYVSNAYSVMTINQSSMPCSGPWMYAALNTAPNPNGWADGCEVGKAVQQKNSSGCAPQYSGSFYVVSCGTFVNVTWVNNVSTPGDVTIDIN